MLNLNGKKVSPSLAAAAEIRTKYFDKEPTFLTLKEIKDEVIRDYDYLPSLEVGMLFMLVDGWYASLQKELVGALQ